MPTERASHLIPVGSYRRPGSPVTLGPPHCPVQPLGHPRMSDFIIDADPYIPSGTPATVEQVIAMVVDGILPADKVTALSADQQPAASPKPSRSPSLTASKPGPTSPTTPKC